MFSGRGDNGSGSDMKIIGKAPQPAEMGSRSSLRIDALPKPLKMLCNCPPQSTHQKRRLLQHEYVKVSRCFSLNWKASCTGQGGRYYEEEER